MPDEEPEREVDAAAENMESQVDEMEERTQRLGDEVDAARKDWDAKREDPAVPGAVPREGEDEADD